MGAAIIKLFRVLDMKKYKISNGTLYERINIKLYANLIIFMKKRVIHSNLALLTESIFSQLTWYSICVACCSGIVN